MHVSVSRGFGAVYRMMNGLESLLSNRISERPTVMCS